MKRIFIIVLLTLIWCAGAYGFPPPLPSSADMEKSTYDSGEDGTIDPAAGGTGQDSSSSTGVARVDAGTWSFTKDKLDGTAAPTANDDSTQGYAVGSDWIDITNDRTYKCVDATAAAAVWLCLSGCEHAGTDVTADLEEEAHASEHIDGGDDPVDGDKLEITWTPSSITPDTGIAEADSADDLAAILEGIEDWLDDMDTDTDGAVDNLEIPIAVTEDSGAVTLWNMSVSGTPVDGTEQSFSFQIDSQTILKLYAEADSAGGVDTIKAVVQGYEAESALLELWADQGDNDSDKWRLAAADGGNLTIQSYTSGAWVDKFTLTTDVNVTADRMFNSQAYTAGETQATVTEAHMLASKYLTDQGGSAETDLILSDIEYYIGCEIVDTEGNGFEICPPTDEAIYLDGTAIAANDCVDSTGAVGARARLDRQQLADGTWAYFLTTIIGTWADGNDTGD